MEKYILTNIIISENKVEESALFVLPFFFQGTKILEK